MGQDIARTMQTVQQQDLHHAPHIEYCRTSLTDGRYTWRHDNVLKISADCAKKAVEYANKVLEIPESQNDYSLYTLCKMWIRKKDEQKFTSLEQMTGI